MKRQQDHHLEVLQKVRREEENLKRILKRRNPVKRKKLQENLKNQMIKKVLQNLRRKSQKIKQKNQKNHQEEVKKVNKK